MKQRNGYMKICIECQNEYTAILKNSKFCSSACRAINWRTCQSYNASKENNQTRSSDAATSSLVNDFDPSPAIDALRYEADHWKTAYKEERKKCEELEDELV